MNRLISVLLVLLVIVTAFAASLGYLYTSSSSRADTITTTQIMSTIVSSTNILTLVKVTNTFVTTDVTNVITTTSVTYLQLSGLTHPVFYVTELVVIQPVEVNEICVLFPENQTISSTYYFPSQITNGTNPIGIVTTSIDYQNETTSTRYDNITVISNGTVTCTGINPYYNVTQSGSCTCV